MLQTGTGRSAQVAEPFLHTHTRIRQRLLKRLVGTASAQSQAERHTLNFLKILQEFSKIPGQTPRILENPPKIFKVSPKFYKYPYNTGFADGLH